MYVEDAIETMIGRFGKYQTWILVLVLLGKYPSDFQATNVVFILPSMDYVCVDGDSNHSVNVCPCENPIYDQSTIVSSVTSEWDLICNRTWLASLSQSILQVGMLFGSIVFGYVSDNYGRKVALLNALLITVLFGVLAAIASKLWIFIICRFIIGMSVGGIVLCSFIILVEICGKSFRPYIAGLEGISYVTGYMIQPIIANQVREWRRLLLFTSAPWLFVVVYYWLLPESPRWLITVGKKKEAIEVLTNIAKRNQRPTDNIETIVNELESLDDKNQKRSTYLDLFKTPKVRLYSIMNALMWMCCSHTFYGINQYIGRLDGNLYLNVTLSAMALAPGLIFVTISSRFLSRRVSTIITFGAAGVFLFIIIFIPDDFPTATLVCAILGQLGAYTSFMLMYLYTSEIFPTIIRNSAMGFASVFARLGSFIAPFVVNIGIEWVSMLIFSGLAFFAVIICFFLPETKDTVLLNTIEQTEMSEEKVNKQPE